MTVPFATEYGSTVILANINKKSNECANFVSEVDSQKFPLENKGPTIIHLGKTLEAWDCAKPSHSQQNVLSNRETYKPKQERKTISFNKSVEFREYQVGSSSTDHYGTKLMDFNDFKLNQEARRSRCRSAVFNFSWSDLPMFTDNMDVAILDDAIRKDANHFTHFHEVDSATVINQQNKSTITVANRLDIQHSEGSKLAPKASLVSVWSHILW
eukprot:CAMPEP_0178938524 /NCGR_PEP_ID=MMETSP0786-20121207/26378_1 /TAXON_ID=186022 /ORGANISM="Thalassionema frauenfeldii, Strain CCMP 1798" /LENGTH=212 /DNA_ID=CAMNT_0020617251 /DNA_START=16 /DNA_END=651 /DNA_ORIENTATION=+